MSVCQLIKQRINSGEALLNERKHHQYIKLWHSDETLFNERKHQQYIKLRHSNETLLNERIHLEYRKLFSPCLLFPPVLNSIRGSSVNSLYEKPVSSYFEFAHRRGRKLSRFEYFPIHVCTIYQSIHLWKAKITNITPICLIYLPRR